MILLPTPSRTSERIGRLAVVTVSLNRASADRHSPRCRRPLVEFVHHPRNGAEAHRQHRQQMGSSLVKIITVRPPCSVDIAANGCLALQPQPRRVLGLLDVGRRRQRFLVVPWGRSRPSLEGPNTIESTTTQSQMVACDVPPMSPVYAPGTSTDPGLGRATAGAEVAVFSSFKAKELTAMCSVRPYSLGAVANRRLQPLSKAGVPISHQTPGHVGQVLTVGPRIGPHVGEGVLDGDVEDFPEKPLACSMITRLASAERSRGITVDGVGACSCRSATHAMCARVCATRRSASFSSPDWVPNSPSAPRTMPAARIGTA